MLAKVKAKFSQIKTRIIEKMAESKWFACLMYVVSAVLSTFVMLMAGGGVANWFFRDVTNPDAVAVGFSVGFVLAGVPAFIAAAVLCFKRLRQ